MQKSFKELFNEKRRDIVWERKETIKTTFREALEVLEFKDKQKHSPRSIGTFEQVEIGYNGLGTQFISGIQSKASIGLNSKETVLDHLIGTKLIGKHVHKVLKNKNYNIEWMVDEWLYENLFLWAKIKLTKTEHQPHNVLRNSSHSIEEKSNFEHYVNVSERI